MESDTATATEHLGRFSASLRLADVPDQLVAKAKRHLLDTIGVACSGLSDPHAKKITSLVQSWGGAPAAGVIGRDIRLPAHKAAFLNALYARVHVYDDTHEAGPAHPGASVVAGALAAAEICGASGEALLVGIVAGYEVATRVAAMLGPSHYAAGFHNTGTCSPFGSSTSASRVLGLDAAQSSAALGLAGETAVGLRQYQQDGSMLDTALNGARGAEAGVVAVEMARAGLTGPRGVLDGEWGLLRLMSGRSQSLLPDDLGKRWEFADTSLKPFATSRFTHGPAAALKMARLDHRQVERVEIYTFGQSIEVSDRPAPQSQREALLSHQEVAAMALLGKAIVPADFVQVDEDVRALAARVSVRHDPALDSEYPATWPHRIQVTLRSGEQVTLHSSMPPPADDESTQYKFRSLATPVLGLRRTEAIISAVARLESLPAADRLVCLLYRSTKHA